jgi:hypothetical protein
METVQAVLTSSSYSRLAAEPRSYADIRDILRY